MPYAITGALWPEEGRWWDTRVMRAMPLGEKAYLLEGLPGPAYMWADHIRGQSWDGVTDVVPGYESVGVYVDPDRFAPSLLDTLATADLPAAREPKVHRIPVCYEMGEDLVEAATTLGIAPDDLIDAHVGVEYRCVTIGFCPGFPYLQRLDPSISGLPRRPDPRTRVPVGSVAITGSQTGVYPLERPGGWWLIGSTPLTLVAVEDAFFPIRAGDQVLFERISTSDFARLQGKRL